jgi:hypothetical protein
MYAAFGEPAQAEDLLALAEPAAVAAGEVSQVYRARAEIADAREDPAARQAAWQRAVARGDDEVREAGLLRLGELSLTAGEPLQAAEHYRRALDLATRRGDRHARIAILNERARCLAEGGQVAAATSDLAAADALLGPDEGSLRSRLLCQRAVLALGRNDFDAALGLATVAREAAVSVSDVLCYLPAVALISAIHAQAGREVDAWDALVRARVSLKDLLGPPGEALVRPAIAASAQRLGAGFERVRDAWIARRRGAST